MVVMRDGARLATDLYFPAGESRARGTILTRTPYDKASFAPNGERAAEVLRFLGAGFVVAVQDLRGTFESEGECAVSRHERHDGYDTVAWLAAQPWSNGRVGTYGCSHRGEVQYQLGAERPPGLACMVVQAGASVFRGETSRSYVHMGGAINLGIAAWYRRWQNTVRPRFPVGTSAEGIRQASPHYTLHAQHDEMRYPEDFRYLPVIDLLDHVGSPPTEWRELIAHAPNAPWWNDRGHVTRDDRFDVPILHVNSWFDFGVHETLTLAAMIRKSALTTRSARNQFVVISPAGHCGSEAWRSGDTLGDVVMRGPDLDFWGLYLRWFRHWLEDDQVPQDRDFPDLAPLTYYSILGDCWNTATEWPPRDAVEAAWYLSSTSGANGLTGDGVLAQFVPAQERADHFTYDPDDPVPTSGGVMWSPGNPPVIPIGPTDQTAVQLRTDVLVYTTSTFDAMQEIAGPIAVDLYVSSSAADTDFTAKLTVVRPDGKALWLSEGILRLRYWDGLAKTNFVPPGQVRKIAIDLKAIAVTLTPGMRLRLEVSSSNFPRFERNLNTGGNNYDECEGVCARNTVRHGPSYPSCLRLWMRTPTIPIT